MVFPRELDFVELIFDDQQKCRLRDIRFDLGRWSSSHEETEFRLGGDVSETPGNSAENLLPIR